MPEKIVTINDKYSSKNPKTINMQHYEKFLSSINYYHFLKRKFEEVSLHNKGLIDLILKPLQASF